MNAKAGAAISLSQTSLIIWLTSLRLIFFYVSLNVLQFKVITFVSTYRRLWGTWNKDDVNCGKTNLNEDMNPNDPGCGNCKLQFKQFRSGGDISKCPRKARCSALRSLGQGGSLGPLNIYARYTAVSFSWSRRPSVPNHVWWNVSAKMSTYRRAHTHIMFRCWILHLPLLWQPHYTISAFGLLLYLA